MLKLLAPFQTCCFFKYAVSGMKVLLNMSEGLFLILRSLDMKMLTIDSERSVMHGCILMLFSTNSSSFLVLAVVEDVLNLHNFTPLKRAHVNM
jgi:hypothetical protein